MKGTESCSHAEGVCSAGWLDSSPTASELFPRRRAEAAVVVLTVSEPPEEQGRPNNHLIWCQNAL